MKKSSQILLRSLVRPFYRQNAGQLVFIFILFFGAVGELEGTQIHTGPLYQFHYQYALILGMLSSPVLFGLVLFAWLLYAEKNAQFILSTLQRPEYSYLYLLNRWPSKTLFGLLFRIQFLLFLPIAVYSFAILGVAIYKGWYLSGLAVIGYILVLNLLCAARYHYQIQHPGRSPLMLLSRLLPTFPGGVSYWEIFIQYLFREQKLLLTGIKLFSCGLLYLSVQAVDKEYYDLRMVSLLFGIGILGHSILIYRNRELEERVLIFYRGLPLSLFRRLGQHATLYAVLLIPEVITICLLIPEPLHYADAARLLLTGYGFLLFLNSLLFIAPFTMKLFLKVVLCLFLVLYFSVMADALSWLAIVTLIGAAGIYYRAYYRFDTAKPGIS